MSKEQSSKKQSTDPRPAPAVIKAVKKKIGEARGNLARREAWYQRRTGGTCFCRRSPR